MRIESPDPEVRWTENLATKKGAGVGKSLLCRPTYCCTPPRSLTALAPCLFLWIKPLGGAPNDGGATGVQIFHTIAGLKSGPTNGHANSQHRIHFTSGPLHSFDLRVKLQLRCTSRRPAEFYIDLFDPQCCEGQMSLLLLRPQAPNMSSLNPSRPLWRQSLEEMP